MGMFPELHNCLLTLVPASYFPTMGCRGQSWGTILLKQADLHQSELSNIQDRVGQHLGTFLCILQGDNLQAWWSWIPASPCLATGLSTSTILWRGQRQSLSTWFNNCLDYHIFYERHCRNTDPFLLKPHIIFWCVSYPQGSDISDYFITIIWNIWMYFIALLTLPKTIPGGE